MSGFLSAISTVGTVIYQTIFELSPIMLVGGIAQAFGGGQVPIISFTEADHFVLGLLSGNNPFDLDNAFAHFQPLPGSTLLDLEIGSYPFANQTVAANATINKPLTLSYKMLCPPRGFAGYLSRLDTMINLQQMLTQHAALGGTYTCLTPAAFYYNGILTSLRDISDGEPAHTQSAYQWDFVFPLLTLNQAQAAQNSLMSKLSAQTQISGAPAWSGVATTVGSPSSLATPSLIPGASGLPAIAPTSGTSFSGASFPGFA